PGRRRLDGLDVVLRGLVRRIGVDPQDELVERHHGDRREVLPAERNAGRERRGEQVRQRDHELVRIAARALHVEKTFAAGAAGLVDDHHRGGHQVVLGDDALDDAGHLIGATAGAGRYDELDRSGRLPGGGGRCRHRPQQCGRSHCEDEYWFTHGRLSPVYFVLLALFSPFGWAPCTTSPWNTGYQRDSALV